MLEDIESNVAAAEDHVAGGTKAIQKAQVFQKKSRNKLMCGLVTAMVLVGLLVAIIFITKKG